MTHIVRPRRTSTQCPAGSASIDLCRLCSYDGIEEAAALGAGEVRAVVASAPVLEHWVIRHPGESARVVGAPFHPDKFAFATSRRTDDFTDRISVELIRLQENGRLEELRKKYFGGER